MTFYFRLRVGHNNPLPLPKLSASSFFMVIEFGSDEESSFPPAIMFLPSAPEGIFPGAANNFISQTKKKKINSSLSSPPVKKKIPNKKRKLFLV